MTGEHQYPEYIARFLRYFELPGSLGVKLPTYEELLTAARAYADDLSRELAILRQTGGLPGVIAQFAREEEEWRKTALLLDDPASRDSQYRKTLITHLLLNDQPMLSSSFRHYLPERTTSSPGPSIDTGKPGLT